MIAPYEIDGVILTKSQRDDFDHTYHLLIDAQHNFVNAMHLTIRNFKKLYQIKSDKWIPLEHVFFAANSKIIRGRTWRRENMGLRKKRKVQETSLDKIHNTIETILSNLTEDQKSQFVKRLKNKGTK